MNEACPRLVQLCNSLMFAIEVPDGAKPGDPIKVRLPDGVTVVKITVPEGAGPGTTLEFELPSEEKEKKAPPPKKEQSMDQKAVPAHLHSEEKVRMSSAGADLANAAPERIYVIHLPEDVVPGKPLVAEIMEAAGWFSLKRWGWFHFVMRERDHCT